MEELDPTGREPIEANVGDKPPSPRARLLSRLPYWRFTMRQIGVVCALTLSYLAPRLAGGFRWIGIQLWERLPPHSCGTTPWPLPRRCL